MWGDEVDASLDSENHDTNLFFDFMVAKRNKQEENAVARKGFMVQCLIVVDFPPY